MLMLTSLINVEQTDNVNVSKCYECRANRDKESLEGKLRNATDSARGNTRDTAIKPLGMSTQSGAATTQTHNVQDLKKRNHELEDEVITPSYELNGAMVSRIVFVHR